MAERKPVRGKGERGVVLAQVLVATVILGYLATMILEMTLQPAMYASNATASVTKSKAAEAALNRIQSAWMDNGATCSSHTGLGVRCTVGSGCACVCSVRGAAAVSSSGPAAGPCTLAASLP
jgi:Tfp pilus assembly protein PilX